jgi:hypothetical protein
MQIRKTDLGQDSASTKIFIESFPYPVTNPSILPISMRVSDLEPKRFQSRRIVSTGIRRKE